MTKIINFLLFTIKKGAIVYLLLASFLFFHGYLIYKTFVFDKVGEIRVLRAGYGDIPFHMTQVSKFGYTDIFNFNEPLFNGDKIRYAFLVNFLSGLLLRLTGSWMFAMHFVAIGLMTVSSILAFLTYKMWLGKRWAALLALVLFLLGSGMGAWSYITQHLSVNPYHWSEFTDYLIDNSVSTVSDWRPVYPHQTINWGASLSLVFLHQRSFFFGVFLFTLSLYLLTRFPDLKNKYAVWLLGIALGLGPLGHYHTFVALCLVLGSYFIIFLFRKDYLLSKRLFLVGLIAFVIALPQVIYLLSGNNPLSGNNSFVHYRFGWMTDPGIGSVKYPEGLKLNWLTKFIIYLKFNWVNFGFILPILALCFLSRTVRSINKTFPFIWLAAVLFIFNNFVQLQPWDYDNNKILVYFMFFAAGSIMYVLVKIHENRKYLGLLLMLVLYPLFIFSGVVDILPRALVPINEMPIIFNRDAIRMSYFVRQNIEPRDVVITTSTHLNLVSSLAGRPSVVGFPGWLWTKGIDYGSREQDLRNFYLDPLGNFNIAKKYNAKYVLLDPTAIYDWKLDRVLFDQNFKELFSSGGHTLYSLR